MSKLRKFGTAALVAGSSVVALAEGAAQSKTPDQIATDLEGAFTGVITPASNSVVAILTAGVVIVAAFFIWRVLKRALNGAK